MERINGANRSQIEWNPMLCDGIVFHYIDEIPEDITEHCETALTRVKSFANCQCDSTIHIYLYPTHCQFKAVFGEGRTVLIDEKQRKSMQLQAITCSCSFFIWLTANGATTTPSGSKCSAIGQKGISRLSAI